MADQLEFDLGDGRARRDLGKGLAAGTREEILGLARVIAERIARAEGEVTADDVQRELIGRGYTPHQLGNAAGSIFDGRKWELTGWRPSTRVSRHANRVGVWRLRRVFL